MRIGWRYVGLSFLVGASLVYFSGCKPPAGTATNVKTLDNFAAGERIRTNVCEVDPSMAANPEYANPMGKVKDLKKGRIRVDGSVDAGRADALYEEAKKALSAVPADMQQMFMDLGGYVNISSETNDVCTRLFKQNNSNRVKAGLEDVTGCFTFEKQGNKTRFRINVAPTESDIRHSIVRVFGYLYAQMFSRLQSPTSDGAKAEGARFEIGEKESFQFSNLKARLAQNFLADMAERDKTGLFELKTMEKMLGAGAADIIRDRYARVVKAGSSVTDRIEANLGSHTDGKFYPMPSRAPKFPGEDLLDINSLSFLYPGENAKDFANFQEVKEFRRKRFEDYVFAEAFDSYYCHPFGQYVSKEKVNQLKTQTVSTEDRNAAFGAFENTKFVMRDFFPHSYTMFGELNTVLINISKRYGGKPTSGNAPRLTRGASSGGNGFALQSSDSLNSILAALMPALENMPAQGALQQQQNNSPTIQDPTIVQNNNPNNNVAPGGGLDDNGFSNSG